MQPKVGTGYSLFTRGPILSSRRAGKQPSWVPGTYDTFGSSASPLPSLFFTRPLLETAWFKINEPVRRRGRKVFSSQVQQSMALSGRLFWKWLREHEAKQRIAPRRINAQHELVTWSRFTWGLARCKGLLFSRLVPAGVSLLNCNYVTRPSFITPYVDSR